MYQSCTRGLACFCVVLAVCGNGTVWGADRPNVLLIVIDDLNHSIGCYGATHVHTPNIDRLAARGMRFDRAYVQVTFCNPSRTSFLTGMRPDQTGVMDNRIFFRETMPDVVTLPQLFRQNDYTTMRFGKIFHDGEAMDDPKSWDRAVYPEPTELGKRGQRRNMTGGVLKWCWWMMAEGDDEDQPDGQIARHAIRFLRGSHTRPFLMTLGFYKPHDPFVAPKKYFDMYPLDQIKVHRDPVDRSEEIPWAMRLDRKRLFDKFTDRERREFLRSYYAGTSFIDAQIGKVLDCLDQSPYARNTIVVFISDHGYHLGQRGWWNKTTLFELSARSPMIVYVPGRTAGGSVCERLVEFVDIYPTLTQLCRLPPPEGLAGRSFVPLLENPDQPWKRAAYTQLTRDGVDGRTVRTERWRYIEWDQGRSGRELYDHDRDPGEYHNLADDPAWKNVVERHRKLLENMRARPKTELE